MLTPFTSRPRRVALSFALALAAAVPACGARTALFGSDDGGPVAIDPGPGPFAGAWTGNADTSVALDGGVQNSTTSLTFTFAPSATDSMTVTMTPTGGGEGCTFTARRTGATATLPAGQVCVLAGASARWTLTGGTAQIVGTTLRLTLQGPLTGSGVTGDARITFTGTHL